MVNSTVKETDFLIYTYAYLDEDNGRQNITETDWKPNKVNKTDFQGKVKVALLGEDAKMMDCRPSANLKINKHINKKKNKADIQIAKYCNHTSASFGFYSTCY